MGVVDALTEWRAQRWLSVLAARFGAEGLRVAGAVPRLGAAVDQHAAAVRDLLAGGVDRRSAGETPLTDRVLLAGYARGLLDRSGISVEELRGRTPVWVEADWLTLRLLAVCAMSRALPGRAAARRTPAR